MVTWFQFAWRQSTKDLQRETSHLSEEEANSQAASHKLIYVLSLKHVYSTDDYTDDSYW